jgi:hypothetical protein
MQNIKLPPGFPFLTVLEGFVKNVCISDVVTGLIFFQKVYKWKESSAFNNLGEVAGRKRTYHSSVIVGWIVPMGRSIDEMVTMISTIDLSTLFEFILRIHL